MSGNKIRISAVKYANTYPFIYGLSATGFDKKVDLTTDHPAQCAEKLINGEADIGLIPVAAFPQLKEYHVITDFCLGAYGNVRTVMLLSNCPFSELDTINLDYRSKSSVTLARILALKFWRKEFRWKATSAENDFRSIPCNEGIVLIGDQCFEYEKNFDYRIDLAGEWFRFTGLPFAFACWTSNKELEKGFLSEFNEALAHGVSNIDKVVEQYGSTGVIRGRDLYTYLTGNMDFILNDDKKQAIELFLSYMREI
jgi:chorismate dehydratase